MEQNRSTPQSLHASTPAWLSEARDKAKNFLNMRFRKEEQIRNIAVAFTVAPRGL
jgi:hypothetical protein